MNDCHTGSWVNGYDQLAAVNIGPRRLCKPEKALWLYCQTASATTTGAPGESPRHVHAHLLAGDKAMVSLGIVQMRSANLDSFGLEGRYGSCFHGGLRWPTPLMWRLAQIPARNLRPMIR
jgi:hypothetical protein